MDSDLNYIDRDPEDISAYIKVGYDEIIAEPDDLHSLPCVWRNSYKCFSVAKNSCYRIMTTICGIPLACSLGCSFAFTTFAHIWFFTPCFRFFTINVFCFKRFFSVLIHCLLDPICESCGLCLSRINVNVTPGRILTTSGREPTTKVMPVQHRVKNGNLESVLTSLSSKSAVRVENEYNPPVYEVMLNDE